MIWNNHLILPPSLHQSKGKYSFGFCDIPLYPPNFVNINQIERCIENLCYENGGYNTSWVENKYIESYHDYKIDLSPLIIDQNQYSKLLDNLSTDIQDYYSNIAYDIDKIYLKPHYQSDLLLLTRDLQNICQHKKVIELACGSGYWTEKIAQTATEVLGIDINASCINLASRRKYHLNNTKFIVQDLFSKDIDYQFESAFGAFIYSHIKIEELEYFFDSVNQLVKTGGTVIILDNKFVASNGLEIDKTDNVGNTYQIRYAKQNKQKYLIVKNYPDKKLIYSILKNRGTEIVYKEYDYFWLLTYKIVTKKIFVCLANSKKYGGRCIAGIELNQDVNSSFSLVKHNSNPNWIRPISKTEHGEVDSTLVEHIKIGDIVEINISEICPQGYQSENVLFDTSSISILGKMPLSLTILRTVKKWEEKSYSSDKVQIMNQSTK